MPEALHPGGDQDSPVKEGGEKPVPEALRPGAGQNLPVKGEGKNQIASRGGQFARSAALEVRFEGGDISPDKIPMPDLASVIRAVRRLASGHIADDSAPLPEGEKLRLVGVRRGSARYALAGPPPAIASVNLRVLGGVIDRPDQIGENDYLLHPVGILSHAAAKLRCRISIREPSSGGGAVLARIGPETYKHLTKSILITGQTEFGGKVERVGGASRSRCGLRVAFQKRILICRVPNPADARILGENLYKRVVVSGEAAWIKSTWRVFAFRVEAVRPLKDGSLSDKIRAIREAGGSDWDRVSDVRGYLDLGGEDDR